MYSLPTSQRRVFLPTLTENNTPSNMKNFLKQSFLLITHIYDFTRRFFAHSLPTFDLFGLC